VDESIIPIWIILYVSGEKGEGKREDIDRRLHTLLCSKTTYHCQTRDLKLIRTVQP